MNENNSPSDEENQEPKTEPEVNVADIVNPEPVASGTIPVPDHGWLEQFSAFGLEAWKELEGVASQGLVAAETDLLIALAVKLLKLAKVHDPDAFHKAAAEENL